MNSKEVKNPNILITVLFVFAAAIGMGGISLPISFTETGLTLVGIAFVVIGNIGFWGMVYRVSKHVKFYLQGTPGAEFIRIVVVAGLVISFIFATSFIYSMAREPIVDSTPDPFAELSRPANN